jgi:polygalacturonase
MKYKFPIQFTIILAVLGQIPVGFINAQSMPRNYDITQFGAISDGITLNTEAIQKAVDQCHTDGGGNVLIPKGDFVTGSICLKDNVTILLAADAVLLGSIKRTDYDRNRWYALILANGARNIGIGGKGIIDGRGKALAADTDAMYKKGLIQGGYKDNRTHESERPQLIDFEHCTNIKISGVTLKNAACWVQRYGRCDSLVIDDIKVRSTAFWNNDGIDLVDCTNTLVQNCDIDVGDDGICLKSDRKDLSCNHILIRHCKVRSSASAVKFGTNSYGGFRNIKVDDIEVYNTFRSAIALEIVDGGVMEDVEVSNIRAENTGNAFFIRLGHRTQRFPPGQVRRIYLHDIKVAVPAGKPDIGYEHEGPPVKEPHNLMPASIVGIPGHPIVDVRLENIRISYAGGGDRNIAFVPIDSLSKVPERERDYPEFSMFGELPAWGLYCRHVDGLQMDRVRLRKKVADYRGMVVLDDVLRVQMRRTSRR